MTDRVYPSKPNAAAAPAAATTNATAPSFPPTKSQLYKPNPHPYRPNNHQTTTNRRRRGRRGCFCLCCFWSILLLTILLFLIAVAACVFYLLYTPHRPSFSVISLRISRFNLTTADDTSHLAAAFNLTLSAKNPNKRISFFYDHISITAETSNNDVVLANGSFPKFPNYPKNTTVIRSFLSTASEIADIDSVASLRSDLKKKTGIPLKIVLDTWLVVNLDGIKTKKVLIRVTCDGIHGGVPKGKPPKAVVASTAGSKCKVDVLFKIWKWTF